METLESVKARAKNWLFDVAAPFWSTKGLHESGMFVEAFEHNGTKIDNRRRVMVQGRQIYCFSELGRLGWTGPWKDIVETAIGHFIGKYKNQDGFFIHTLDSEMKPQDSRLDLYNQAFAMFALGNAANALNDAKLFEEAKSLLSRLNEKWARQEGGFWEGEITPCPPYRQNPHMHIFEAAFANYGFTNDIVWKQLMDDMYSLFVGKFQNQEFGAVTEYFDENWKPLNSDEGKIVEPGHCFEWAWLFDTAFPNGAGAKTAKELIDFARKNGICPNRDIAINEVLLNGDIVNNNGRLWPQTERLKAAASSYRREGTQEEINEIARAYNGLEKYFQAPILGLFHDKLKPDGTFIEEPAPTSSFYHIVCGISELLRL